MTWSEICLNHYGKDVLGKIVFSQRNSQSVRRLTTIKSKIFQFSRMDWPGNVFVSWLQATGQHQS